MNLDELREAVGAQTVMGCIRAVVDGEHVLIARNSPDGFVMTNEGKALAEKLEAKAKPKRTRKKAASAPAEDVGTDGGDD